MSDYNPEHAKRDLQEIAATCSAWWQNRNTDSMRTQSLRDLDMVIVSRKLEELVPAVQPQQKLQLQIGSAAVRGSTFNTNAYDFLEEHSQMLEPGKTLDLVHTQGQWANNTGFRERILYAGEYGTVIRLDRLSQAIGQGSLLVLVDQD